MDTVNRLRLKLIAAFFACIALFSGCNLIGSLFDSVRDIHVSPANISIAPFDKVQLSAFCIRTDGSIEDITSTAQWSSSNDSMVRIVGPGLIEAEAGSFGCSRVLPRRVVERQLFSCGFRGDQECRRQDSDQERAVIRRR